MSVTLKDVEYVANLARLQLSDEEAQQLVKDMNQILEYMDLLNKVDTDNVAPLEHVIEISGAFRKDAAEAALDRESALKNAPDANQGYFRVPRVIE